MIAATCIDPVASQGNDRSLTISKTTLEDSAEYTCILDGVRVKTTLEVEIPYVAPSVSSECLKSDFWVKKGEDAIIEIPFYGYPPPKAEWTFKGKSVKKTKKYVPSVSDTSVRFTVKQVDQTETGVYTCKLTNECGDVTVQVTIRLLGNLIFCFHSILKEVHSRPFIQNCYASLCFALLYLKPEEKPDAPSTPECLATTDDSITILWKAPANDGGSRVTNYVVEYQEKTSQKYHRFFFWFCSAAFNQWVRNSVFRVYEK